MLDWQPSNCCGVLTKDTHRARRTSEPCMGPATNSYHNFAATRPINSFVKAKFLP
jgi:hypothetical protein